jgi:hypothetical protein
MGAMAEMEVKYGGGGSRSVEWWKQECGDVLPSRDTEEVLYKQQHGYMVS